MSFDKLVEAMKGGGCPICRRIALDIGRAIESLMYDGVNDVGLRLRIRADMGLCQAHARQVARRNNALAGAILFADLLEQASQRCEKLKRRWGGGSELKQLGRQVCIYCRDERETAKIACAVLADHADDAEVSAGMAGGALLCVAHLGMTAPQIAGRERRRAFVETHQQRYAEVVEQMRRLIASYSYDARAMPTEAEQNAWLRAIELLNGAAGSS
jgi:hypothetical protein